MPHRRQNGVDDFSDWEVNTICQSYVNGATIDELLRRFHTSAKLINEVLAMKNVEKRSRTLQKNTGILPKNVSSASARNHRRRRNIK